MFNFGILKVDWNFVFVFLDVMRKYYVWCVGFYVDLVCDVFVYGWFLVYVID